MPKNQSTDRITSITSTKTDANSPVEIRQTKLLPLLTLPPIYGVRIISNIASIFFNLIDYNTKLVWLDEKVIPDTIIQAMNQVEYKLYDISFIKNNYLILIKQENNIEEVFEGVDLEVPF